MPPALAPSDVGVFCFSSLYKSLDSASAELPTSSRCADREFPVTGGWHRRHSGNDGSQRADADSDASIDVAPALAGFGTQDKKDDPVSVASLQGSLDSIYMDLFSMKMDMWKIRLELRKRGGGGHAKSGQGFVRRHGEGSLTTTTFAALKCGIFKPTKSESSLQGMRCGARTSGGVLGKKPRRH